MNKSPTYTNLEIRILKPDDRGYPIELTVDHGQQFQGAHLATDFLPWTPGPSPVEDGKRLYSWLFKDAGLQRAWSQIRGQVARRRIRLRIDADAPELHAMPWELLRDIDAAFEAQTLAVDADTPFSRYLAGQWEAGRPITERPIKMLVAIANPDGLEEYGLSQINVTQEKAAIQQALAATNPDQLDVTFLDDTVSLSRLAVKLKKGVHILHLIAHGTFSHNKQTASLYLADEENDVRLVQAGEFAAMISRLSQPPQLIYLSSCETATRSPADAFRGFAPTLITAGVPAVLAMQDLVPMKTAQTFAQTFYRQLLGHGIVDLAGNEARAAILNADLPGGAIPVLFSRLPDNRLFDLAGPETTAQLDYPPPPEPARPPVLKQFIGRQNELRYFAQKLRDTHLAVISGMPGVGKTSLAATLAETWQGWQMSEGVVSNSADQGLAEAHSPFKRKIFWHTFHPDEEVLSVIWQLAGFAAWHGQAGLWQVLQGAQKSGGQPPPLASLLDYVIRLVGSQGYLLCLDDVQYVREDPELTRFIDRLRELVLAGEIDLILTSREVPDYIRTTTFDSLGGLSATDVAQLVTERGLSLDDDLVKALHTHTEGNAELLMLALNLLGRADDVALVVHNLAEADDIERYLVSEVDDELSETDREVMIAVAVLLGYPGSREAIETISARNRLKRVLLALSDRHLLQRQADEEDETYSEHAIVRAFYYDVPGRRELRALHRLAGEHYELDELDLFKSALHYVQAGEYEKAADLVTDNIWQFINQGHARALRRLLSAFSEQMLDPERWAEVNMVLGEVEGFLGERDTARTRFETALAVLDGLPDSAGVRELQAGTCRGMGELLRDQVPQEALTWFERGLTELGDTESDERATILLKMSTALIFSGDYQVALNGVQEALTLISADESWLRMGAFINLGAIYLRQGNLKEAIHITEKGLAISRKLHDLFQMTTLWNNLAISRDLVGDWTGATAAYEEALRLAQELGNINQQTAIGSNLAYLYTLQGKLEQALSKLQDSLKLARRHNLSRSAMQALSNLANIYLYQHDLHAAVETLTEAERIALQIDVNEDLPFIFRCWTQLHLLSQASGRALDCAEKSVTLSQNLKAPLEEGMSLRLLALAHLATNQPLAALEAFSQSLALLEGNDPYEAARTRLEWGRYLLSGPNVEQGKTLLHQARDTFAKLGARRDLAIAEEILE